MIAVDSLALGILDADLVDFARSLSDASHSVRAVMRDAQWIV